MLAYIQPIWGAIRAGASAASLRLMILSAVGAVVTGAVSAWPAVERLAERQPRLAFVGGAHEMCRPSAFAAYRPPNPEICGLS